jgi:hypothetical protein
MNVAYLNASNIGVGNVVLDNIIVNGSLIVNGSTILSSLIVTSLVIQHPNGSRVIGDGIVNVTSVICHDLDAELITVTTLTGDTMTVTTILTIGTKSITVNSNNFKFDLLTFPTSSTGSANNFLQSDGAGNVVWSSVLSVTSVTASTFINGATGSFTGAVSVGSLSSGAVSGTTGTFTGAISGSSGSFTGAISGASSSVTGASTMGSGSSTGDFTVGTSGAYTNGIKANKFTSIGVNDDIRFDSLGTTGRIVFETLYNGGVKFISQDNGDVTYPSNWMNIVGYQPGANRGVTLGTYNYGGTEYRPNVGGSVIDANGIPGGQAPLWLNFYQTPGGACVIVGDSTSAACSSGINDNAFYVTGNMQTSATTRTATLLATTGTITTLGTTTLSSTTGTFTGDLTVGTSGAYTSTIKANKFTSIGTNDNMIFDALGTGNIFFETLQNGGVKFISQDNDKWVNALGYQIGSTRAVSFGTYNYPSSEFRPNIGSTVIDSNGVPLSQAPLWLNWYQTVGGACVIVGDSTSAVCSSGIFDNAFYVTGNMQTSGVIRTPSVIATTSLIIGSTTAVSLSGTSVVLGSLTFPTTLPGTSGQFLKSNGDGTISWGDGTFTNGVTSAGTLTADRLVIGDGSKTVKTSTIDPSTITTNAATLTSNDIVTGSGGNALKTDSSLSISTKIEATKTIHTTGNVEVATSVLTSAGAGTITIPAVTGNMMIDTTYNPRIRLLNLFTSSNPSVAGGSPTEHILSYVGVYETVGITYTGQIIFDLAAFNGNAIVSVQDMSGTIMGSTSLIVRTGETSTAEGTVINVGDVGVNSVPFIKIVVNLSAGSGSFNLRGIRLIASG